MKNDEPLPTYHIDEEGCIVGDQDECTYESLADFIQTGILGFCGCGCEEMNLAYIRDMLTSIDDDSHWKRERAAEVQFFFYWADKEGLTEHGVGIPGWLDERGRTLLDLLNAALPPCETTAPTNPAATPSGRAGPAA
mgnify:CR=1 FL=1